MTDIKLDGPRVVVEGELDANSRMRVRQNGDTAGIWFHQSGPDEDRAFVGMAADDAVGFYGNTGVGWAFVMDTTTGNVGIGTGQTPPADVKLDVGDRMRVRQAEAAGLPAGIWFHQSTPAADRAFVGMADDDAVGLYGNTGAHWGLVMNTTTGNVEVRKGALTVQQGDVEVKKGALAVEQGDVEIKKGALAVHGVKILQGHAGGLQVTTPVGTSIVLEEDAIRVTAGQVTIDLVEEVRKLRAEVDALKGKGKGDAPGEGIPSFDPAVLSNLKLNKGA